MATELSSIENVNPRKVWPNEASDFTPWLAEHIDLLGEALGLDIEITQTEAAVGAFSLDILGKVSGSDRVVIVENQLERTDHVHLGQLLAYAAGLDAKIVVWISPDVRDEHRQAIHWLNEQTTDAVAFFAVNLEVWRIGNSLPAPRFGSALSRSRASSSGSSSKRPRQSEPPSRSHTTSSMLTCCSACSLPVRTSRSRILPTCATTAGRTSALADRAFSWGGAFTASGQFRVELYVDTGDGAENKSAFDQLQNESAAIEAELGEQLTWERLDNRRASRVFAHRDGSVESPGPVLEQHKQWAVDLTPRFRDVFAPRIQVLDLDTPIAAEEHQEAAP